ncbi:MAG: hypothetical protein EHM61_07895 [Acidobacteria bacterium]|nr:MAG: hypothetical protein EHM61_07895 [Acidobacteriota bacterium]
MKPQDVIVRRAVREIIGKQRVAIGPGIPELVERETLPGTQLFRLDAAATRIPVKLAVVEASEVSQTGDLCLAPGSYEADVQAERWVVVTTQTDSSGNPKIVRKCRNHVFRPHCVSTIITEKGVIEVTAKGLVLKEIRPGVSTDEIKKETAASLHIADDIKLMEF